VKERTVSIISLKLGEHFEMFGNISRTALKDDFFCSGVFVALTFSKLLFIALGHDQSSYDRIRESATARKRDFKAQAVLFNQLLKFSDREPSRGPPRNPVKLRSPFFKG
jgi:hypothetical protein